MDDTPEKMFVRFNDYAPSIDAASIRKWSTSKFDGGTEYTRTPPKAEHTDLHYDVMPKVGLSQPPVVSGVYGTPIGEPDLMERAAKHASDNPMPTDGAPEIIFLTPLGLNPKTCADCGEWNGASKALCSSTRRHAKTVDKFSQSRGISDARIAELEAVIRDIAQRTSPLGAKGNPKWVYDIASRALKSEGDG